MIREENGPSDDTVLRSLPFFLSVGEEKRSSNRQESDAFDPLAGLLSRFPLPSSYPSKNFENRLPFDAALLLDPALSSESPLSVQANGTMVSLVSLGVGVWEEG